jgi:2-oxoglutarate ferredoxin oxidoreductase subunit beta
LHADYDPSDRVGAMNYLQERHALGEIVSGLIYVDAGAQDLHHYLNTVETPLNALDVAELCPGAKTLEAINESLRHG